MMPKWIKLIAPVNASKIIYICGKTASNNSALSLKLLMKMSEFYYLLNFHFSSFYNKNTIITLYAIDLLIISCMIILLCVLVDSLTHVVNFLKHNNRTNCWVTSRVQSWADNKVISKRVVKKKFVSLSRVIQLRCCELLR